MQGNIPVLIVVCNDYKNDDKRNGGDDAEHNINSIHGNSDEDVPHCSTSESLAE